MCSASLSKGGEEERGERVKVLRREVSFICIWHTSLLCYSDSTIILITVCLPLPPPSPHPPSYYFCFYWQERWQICSTFCTSLSNWAMKSIGGGFWCMFSTHLKSNTFVPLFFVCIFEFKFGGFFLKRVFHPHRKTFRPDRKTSSYKEDALSPLSLSIFQFLTLWRLSQFFISLKGHYLNFFLMSFFFSACTSRNLKVLQRAQRLRTLYFLHTSKWVSCLCFAVSAQH